MLAAPGFASISVVTPAKNGELELGIIAGADVRGAAYGVCALLRKLGCGYLSTTERGRDWSTMHVNDVRKLRGAGHQRRFRVGPPIRLCCDRPNEFRSADGRERGPPDRRLAPGVGRLPAVLLRIPPGRAEGDDPPHPGRDRHPDGRLISLESPRRCRRASGRREARGCSRRRRSSNGSPACAWPASGRRT